MIDNTNIPYADKVQPLTVRDQLAAAALTGLLVDTFGQDILDNVAKRAYEAADAMLAARAK
jgi:hypothetical protein